jgi:hypothetical protein
MGTAVRPAKASPDPWDAFGDVDVFVDEVLAALYGRPVRGNRYFHFHGKFCRAFCLSRPTKPPLYKDPVVNIGCV